MSLTRRRLLHHSAIGTSAAAAMSLLPRPLTAMLGGARPEPIPPIQDDRVKALVQRGLDAAKSAGATYADVRMTYTRTRSYMNSYVNPSLEDESMHVGIRALVNGYWGFATSPVWSPEELTRLGQAAVRQAKANTLGKPREFVFPSIPVVHDGHWETPVELDPFVLHPNEISEYLLTMEVKIGDLVAQFTPYGDPGSPDVPLSYGATRQSKAFGSTDGSYCTQNLCRSEGSAQVRGEYHGSANLLLTPTAMGWELFRNSPILETIRKDIQHNLEMAKLPVAPIDVGRYVTVFDALSVARLLSQTVGAAMQLDRSLGYEANAGGTSYLIDPDEMLGTYNVTGPVVTVTANRNERGGAATTRWDDEGVESTSFPLLDRGVVTDFLTSREGAGWLKPRYEQLKRGVRSNGCMYSQTANDAPTIHTPNLAIQPDAKGSSFENLEASIEKGMSIQFMTPQMDAQLLSGYSNWFECYEIRNGKRVARVQGASVLFRTPEIWKSILALGGTASQQRFGIKTQKGEPVVENYHSVTAVPMAIKELTYIDGTRR